jgi:hypothetical protein
MVKTPTNDSVMVRLSTHEERGHSKDPRKIHNYFGKGSAVLPNLPFENEGAD